MPVLAAMVATLFLLGCGEKNYGDAVSITPEQMQAKNEARIKEIENDPHMPQRAKDAAIGAIRRSQQLGKTGTGQK